MKKNAEFKLARLAGLLLLTISGLLSVSAARAQNASGVTPQFEVSGAYSYVRANPDNSAGGFNLQGGSGSLTYNFSDRFAVLADVGAYRFTGLPSGLNSTMYTYLFGPRITLRKSNRFTPFAQVLLGGGRLNASTSGVDAGENGFAMALGGGLDVSFGRRLAIRVGEVDYLLTRFDNVSGSSATQNNVRVSAGIVFRFGSR
jgi:outer membrane immunogenic protein